MNDADIGLPSPADAPVRAPLLGTVDAVLFDLDGTLADTAPDLAAAANTMRRVRGLPLLPLDPLRRVASSGARGLLGVAFDIGPDHADFPSMRDEFLANYARDLCIETTLFPGIAELLAALDQRGIRWGIVTNKAERLTLPLVAQLPLHPTNACIVSGDTTPHAKPHPAPLLHAASLIDVAPSRIVYVGDDLRDIQAGRAAGMMTVAAAYGYCGDALPAAEWSADHLIDTPMALLPLLDTPRN
ncbi:HAD-IA family hydrolase [Robbsia sp. KACC 23696]|uniref:HAD-IA family hydrolase n=1 Tax=Robbsia sp. KACC 23696 TaxID=3149231 RepID=UPI00325B63E6